VKHALVIRFMKESDGPQAFAMSLAAREVAVAVLGCDVSTRTELLASGGNLSTFSAELTVFDNSDELLTTAHECFSKVLAAMHVSAYVDQTIECTVIRAKGFHKEGQGQKTRP
jgi:hypothetical protein